MSDENVASSLLMLRKPEDVENLDKSNNSKNVGKNIGSLSSSGKSSINMGMNNTALELIDSGTLSAKIPKKRKSSSQTVEELRKYFHLPIQTVSKELGICTTILKKICRTNNIQKWPYRQIKSLTCAIQSLEVAMLNSSVTARDKITMNAQISTLQSSIDAIFADPSILSKS